MLLRFFHPSDEMYGADRVLVETVRIVCQAVPGIDVECVLPRDAEYPGHRLCEALHGTCADAAHVHWPVIRRRYLGPRLPVLLREAIRFAVSNRREPQPAADLVVLNTSASLLVAPACRDAQRVILHMHEIWKLWERKGLGALLRFVDEIWCVSSATRDSLPQWAQHRAHVIYNGFPDRSYARRERPEIRRDDEQPYLLLASRWNTWKGHECFLRAWARAGREDLTLKIAGGPPPAGASVDVPGLVRSLGLRNVQFLGELDDIGPVLEGATAVVVPSTRPDPLPTVALEAFRSGVAVIASATGGLPEIVEDDCNGRLLPVNDEGAWSHALATLSVEDLRKLGEGARETFANKFSAARYRARILQRLAPFFAGDSHIEAAGA